MKQLGGRIITRAIEGVPEDEYRFEAEISNDILDAHHSRMDAETTLANFVEDASNGVPLQDSHSNEISRTLGRSVEAKLEGERAIATFSMLRDAPETPDNMKVGEYIRRVERGMFTDVSVGFSGGQDICDIDGLDIWGRSPTR